MFEKWGQDLKLEIFENLMTIWNGFAHATPRGLKAWKISRSARHAAFAIARELRHADQSARHHKNILPIIGMYPPAPV